MGLEAALTHLAGLHVEHIEVGPDEVVVAVRARAPTADCPTCRQTSRRVHSRYVRRVTDLPLAGRRVRLHLQIRRFRCRDGCWPRRTFAEPVPTLVARSARHTLPLQDLLRDLGPTLGGRPGARFARRQGVRVSRTTLLRRVRQLPDPPTPACSALGVDDFALKRGHRYGTLLVDLTTRRPIDLLPDRTAETLMHWLARRVAPEVICRDRSGAYAQGAREGAPTAVQIADRFHVLRNSSDVLARVLARHSAALKATVAQPNAEAETETDAQTDAEAEVATVGVRPTAPVDERRQRRQARYEAVVALYEAGHSITAISQELHLARATVRAYLRAGQFPERPARRTVLGAGARHGAYLLERWQAGCHEATVLWQELRERGFTGPLRLVQRAVAPWRSAPRCRRPRSDTATSTRSPRSTLPVPSAQQAVWLLLTPDADLTRDQHTMRSRLLAAAPAVETVLALVQQFRTIVRTHDHARFQPWLVQAEASSTREVRAFAATLRRDQAAVEAALTYAWSSGPVEGPVTRVKVIKRQMYGRGNFDLLRKRVLLAS